MKKIIAYCVKRQAWENPVSKCETLLLRFEDGSETEEHWHPSEHATYQDRFKDATVISKYEWVNSRSSD